MKKFWGLIFYLLLTLLKFNSAILKDINYMLVLKFYPTWRNFWDVTSEVKVNIPVPIGDWYYREQFLIVFKDLSKWVVDIYFILIGLWWVLAIGFFPIMLSYFFFKILRKPK